MSQAISQQRLWNEKFNISGVELQRPYPRVPPLVYPSQEASRYNQWRQGSPGVQKSCIIDLIWKKPISIQMSFLDARNGMLRRIRRPNFAFIFAEVTLTNSVCVRAAQTTVSGFELSKSSPYLSLL
ncbi:hypothetical protein ACTXT7_014247 [Hymenolepis weldensis]